jgi:hypothetical protein
MRQIGWPADKYYQQILAKLGHPHLVHSILKLCQYVTHGCDVMECEVVVGLEVVEHANGLQG